MSNGICEYAPAGDGAGRRPPADRGSHTVVRMRLADPVTGCFRGRVHRCAGAGNCQVLSAVVDAAIRRISRGVIAIGNMPHDYASFESSIGGKLD